VSEEDPLSPAETRRYQRDYRLLNLIRQRRDFRWIIEVLLAPLGKVHGTKLIVDALIQFVGPDALQKEVAHQCKKQEGRPQRRIPGLALFARSLQRARPDLADGEAIRYALGIESRSPRYKPIYDVLSDPKKRQEIDRFLDLYPDGWGPWDFLDLYPDGLGPWERIKVRPAGRSRPGVGGRRGRRASKKQ